MPPGCIVWIVMGEDPLATVIVASFCPLTVSEPIHPISTSVACVTLFPHMSYICTVVLIVLSGCLNDGIVSIVTLRASPGLITTGMVIGASHGILIIIVSFHALYVGSR